jgi:hypothetical protein
MANPAVTVTAPERSLAHLHDVLQRRATAVPTISGPGCSFDRAWEAFLLPSRPVIITSVTSGWLCERWHDNDGSLNAGAVQEQFAASTCVPVVPLSAATNYGTEGRELALLPRAIHEALHEGAYIKDWHMLKSTSSDWALTSAPLYQVPLYFADDWLNAYCDSGMPGVIMGNDMVHSDYRFCYLGGPGTFTALHHDVMYSCSWSANVAGVKLWLFIPPGDSARTLYDAWENIKYQSILTADEREALCTAVETHRCLGLETSGPTGTSTENASTVVIPPQPPAELIADDLTVMFAIQMPGEAVFVPPGWHHQVHNITHALSINHNWFGATSIVQVWLFIKREWERVRRSIHDCRTTGTGGQLDVKWEHEVQTLLRHNCSFCVDDVIVLLATKWDELLRQQELRGAVGVTVLPAVVPPTYHAIEWPGWYCDYAIEQIRLITADLLHDGYAQALCEDKFDCGGLVVVPFVKRLHELLHMSTAVASGHCPCT